MSNSYSFITPEVAAFLARTGMQLVPASESPVSAGGLHPPANKHPNRQKHTKSMKDVAIPFARSLEKDVIAYLETHPQHRRYESESSLEFWMSILISDTLKFNHSKYATQHQLYTSKFKKCIVRELVKSLLSKQEIRITDPSAAHEPPVTDLSDERELSPSSENRPGSEILPVLQRATLTEPPVFPSRVRLPPFTPLFSDESDVDNSITHSDDVSTVGAYSKRAAGCDPAASEPENSITPSNDASTVSASSKRAPAP